MDSFGRPNLGWRLREVQLPYLIAPHARSIDDLGGTKKKGCVPQQVSDFNSFDFVALLEKTEGRSIIDRKSTRLNSSHGYISYAVFCLKKKKNLYIHFILCLHT